MRGSAEPRAAQRNFPQAARDNLRVKCADCREALSARLDGEDEPFPVDLVDEHVTGCQECRRWHVVAAATTRSLRVRPALATPDLTARILAASAAQVAVVPPDRVRGKGEVLRWALGGVAFVQLCLALAQLLGVDQTAHLAAGAGEHLFNESTAWNLGVAIGLLAAATRPSFARGLLPALAAFVAVLIGVSVADLVTGNVGLDRLGSHAMVVVGLALLYLVDRQHRRNPVPGHAARMPVDGSNLVPTATDIEEPDAGHGGSTRSGRWLRPAGRHAA